MQFPSITLLALAASVSATVIPRDNKGSWNVNVDLRDDGYQYVHADFTSDAYPSTDPLRATCIYDPNQTPVYYRCDQLSFSMKYDPDTQILSLTQSVEKPDPMTVFGEAKIPTDEDRGDGRHIGYGRVSVTSAIA